MQALSVETSGSEGRFTAAHVADTVDTVCRLRVHLDCSRYLGRQDPGLVFAFTQVVPDWLGPEDNPLTLAELRDLARAHYMRAQVRSMTLAATLEQHS